MPAEAVLNPTENPVESARPNMDGPHPGDIIVTDNLWKTYEMGDQQVHALRGVNLRIRNNEYVAIMGALGFGQVDADEPNWVSGLAHTGQVLAERAQRPRS